MVRGYDANRQRRELIATYGKTLAKRAGFACEWCEGKGELRAWDYRPDAEPSEESLALLCGRCRSLADGGKADPVELRSIRDALWSNVPAVAEGAARVLAQCREPWVREAIEESLIDEAVKAELLK